MNVVKLRENVLSDLLEFERRPAGGFLGKVSVVRTFGTTRGVN